MARNKRKRKAKKSRPAASGGPQQVVPASPSVEAALAPASGFLPARLLLHGWGPRLGLLAVVLAGLLHLPTLDHPFHFDDIWKIVENPEIRDLSILLAAFDESWGGEKATRFLPYLSLHLNYRLGGMDSFGFNLLQVLVHMLTVWLVYLFGSMLVRRMPGDFELTPALGALLFAVHPLNTEAVNYQNARPNVMLTMLYVGALCALVRAVDGGKAPGRWLLTVALTVAALLCKELAFSVVLMGPLLIYWLSLGERHDYRRVVRRMRLPMVALVALGVAALFFSGAVTGIRGILLDKGTAIAGNPVSFLLVSAADQSGIFLHYLGLGLLPLPALLLADRSNEGHLYHRIFSGGALRDEVGGQLILPAICSIILVGVLVMVWRERRRFPLITFLVLWTFVAHGPTSVMPRGEPMVEYRTYLPMVGLCLLLGVLLELLLRRLAQGRAPLPLSLGVATAGLLTLLAAGSLARNQDWSSQEKLWLDVIDKAPETARAHNAMGNLLGGRGDLDRAEAYFRSAVEVDPGYGDAHGNLGSVLAQKGDREAAMRALAAAASLVPKNPDVHNNYANLLAQNGDYDDAIIHYQRAIEHKKYFPEAYLNLGLTYAIKGFHEDAMEQYLTALDYNPRLHKAHILLGNSLLARGKVDEALTRYELAVEMAPADGDAYARLARALMYVGKRERAQALLQRALQLDPGNRTAKAVAQELGETP